ncbi:hypothetical protein QFZ34_001260 [Phyllobacterium ifriqiyense]|uniref:CHAT domain-containing protein n=1 Tax=Phyllobacterium ifriqiyense TaxID=314238 RepID=A0ABU0S8M5_9HYPH|nr:hypothetical protein [Phyllobacterium ifriqiyense]MDQ0996083.1 hypothetical protein [Phyllobacterium ifriqiyense]
MEIKTSPHSLSNAIRYVIVLTDDSLEDASLFQGISPGMLDMGWAMRLIPHLPADVFDFGLSFQARKSRRLTGHGWSWTPLSLSNFLKLTISQDDPFWVVMTGTAKAFSAVTEWEKRQTFPILKISTTGKRSLRPENARWIHVRDHLRAVAEKLRLLNAQLPVDELSTTLSAWHAPKAPILAMVAKPHNSTIANLIVLQSLGYQFQGEKTLTSPPRDERPHIKAMVEAALAVVAVQDSGELVPAFLSYPPKPDRIVLAPALYAHTRERLPRPTGDEPPGIRETIRLLQQQTGYMFQGSGTDVAPLMLPAGQYILGMRTKELNAQTLAVSLRAASTLASTVRLPNGVNRATELRDFTGYARGGGTVNGSNKAERVFQSVQRSLQRHAPADLVDIIASSQTGVKLVADAPLEWLPIGDLPMSIALNVSRIPATPGNLMMTQLANNQTLYLPPDAFAEVLVVSSFGPSDPIRNDVRQAMSVIATNSNARLKFYQVWVNTSEEFIAAINGFRGAMMIFDGHGSHDKNTGVGVLHIGAEKIDIWQLRGQMRPPPVVLLSACDTQSPDRTHATAGAGFLACGAISVVGTFLPVRSKNAASLASRLALRAAWYTQAVVGESKRPILWSEIVGGMLRLDFLSDLMTRLEKEKVVDVDRALPLRGSINMLVHTRDPDWWSETKQKLLDATGLDKEALKKHISRTLAEGDSIRYTHIGNPDLLCITDAAVMMQTREHGRTSAYAPQTASTGGVAPA